MGTTIYNSELFEVEYQFAVVGVLMQFQRDIVENASLPVVVHT